MGKLLVHVSDVSRVTPLLNNLHGTEAARYKWTDADQNDIVPANF